MPPSSSVLHRKRVCHVSRRLQIRPSGQRSPPPAAARLGSRWDQLPPTNRQRLLQLLSRLVERQLRSDATSLPTGREEATHELYD
jgi:hypothetical protein